MSVLGCGPTAVGSRASWAPLTPAAPATHKPFPRPLSGNFDRIFNVFERSNGFEYVKSTENCNGDAERHIGKTGAATRPKTANRNDAETKTKNVSRLESLIKNDAALNQDNTANKKSDDTKKKTNTPQTEKEQSNIVDSNNKVKSNAVIRSETALVRSDTITRSETVTWSGGGLETADCALAACAPVDDEEFYREKILYSQARQLFPLQEDLADWINKTIGISYLTGENFLEVLDNGVELCQLAAVIQERAREALKEGTSLRPVPSLRGRCWERAARRSFFSRDNTDNFITFCRELGVHENLLFESDDLVLHHQPRQVIVCLLEVARLAARLGLEPPGLVQLEREIAQEEHDSALADHTLWQFREQSPPQNNKSIEAAPSSQDQNESGVCVSDNADAESTRSDGSTANSTDSDVPLRPTNELDKRVQLVTRLMERGCRCGAGKCSKLLKVKKVGEGRYNIAGRNVFIRLLKGRHMMVRVGGGWDTLEHFLSRHEPCQVRLVTPRTHALLPLPIPSPPPSPGPSSTSLQSPRTSPVPSKTSSHSPSTSPAPSKTSSHSPSTSPAPSKTSSHSPSTSPAPSKTSSQSPRISPERSSGTSSPPRTTRTSTPRSRANLTLPLKAHSVDHVTPKPNTPRSRKSSIPSAIGTPATPGTPTNRSGRATPTGRPGWVTPTNRSGRTTPAEFRKSLTTSSLLDAPKKTRIAKPTTSKDDNPFCGTTRLNQAARKSASAATTPVELMPRNPRSQSVMSVAAEAKKTPALGKKGRSMSLAQTAPLRPLGGRTISAASMTVTPVSGLTQADIEESIRRSLAASIEDHGHNKPFLHIKAKYRSPPPREVPPR